MHESTERIISVICVKIIIIDSVILRRCATEKEKFSLSVIDMY